METYVRIRHWAVAFAMRIFPRAFPRLLILPDTLCAVAVLRPCFAGYTRCSFARGLFGGRIVLLASDVYMGECIAPYVALDPLQAALPVHRPTMTMPLNHDDCEGTKHDACRVDTESLHDSMRRRWEKAAEMYRKAHEGQAIEDLYRRLNHQKALTTQLEYLQGAIAGRGAIRLAYTSAGRPTATVIKDHHALLENALFQTVCRSEAEAYYVVAIINSDALAKSAETFMPRGLFGAWHFHKHGWKLPIPRYDADDPLHGQIGELGAAAEQECRQLIAPSAVMSQPAGDAQSRAARRLLRHEWQPNSATAQAIEVTVAQLLSDPAQAALAQRQVGIVQ